MGTDSNLNTSKVKCFALISRVLVLSIQVVANFLIPDHEADAFRSPIDPDLQVSVGDHIINFLLGGLKRWDAQYFLHLSQYGYTHENTLAFFPLFPLLVRGIANILHVPLQVFFNYHSCLLLAATLLNLYLFIKTAVLFYKLSKTVLKDEEMAYRSALLFCINPASIFFSAPYSECLYWFLTCYSLLSIEEKKHSFGIILLSLASGTRSNGLVNIGFLIYSKLKDCVDYFHRIKNAKTESGSLSLALVLVLSVNYMLIPIFVQTAIVCLPFLLFQLWCYKTFCQEEGAKRDFPFHLDDFLKNNFMHTPDLGSTDWCDNTFPIPYSSVQEKYWEVAPLRYYETKQLPNFLLALPIVLIAISHAALYTVDNGQVFWHLGIPPRNLDAKAEYEKKQWTKTGINSAKVFVYTIHALFLGVFCVLCIHVQVTTRLLCSSSPIVYWFAAYLISDDKTDSLRSKSEAKAKKKAKLATGLCQRLQHYLCVSFPQNFWGQAVLSYFILYFLTGNILFSNFLPWT